MIINLNNFVKHILKYLLRKLGLLNWIRKWRFKKQYRTLINQFKDQAEYEVNFKDINLKFSLKDPFSATFFASYFKNDIYEKEGLNLLLSHVNNNSIVFDVGANIGYFTSFSAKYCSSGKVYAFELGSENVVILKRNIDLNLLTNIVVEHCAVSDSSGTVLVQASAVGSAVLKIMNQKSNHTDLVSVKSITLDEYCEINKMKPEFIKIDVEGAEMKVLQGMKAILEGGIKLLIEIHETDLKYFNSSKEEVMKYIQSYGYNLQIIGNDVKKNVLVFASK